MAQIDVDEYLSFDRNANAMKRGEAQTGPANGKGTFKELIEKLFMRYPRAPALAFRPVMMDDCPEKHMQSLFASYSLTTNNETGSLAVTTSTGRESIFPRFGYSFNE